MSRYIGLDVHDASTTMVVVGPSGKQLAYHVVPTSVHALLELIKAVSRPRYLCFEEGTQSAWLYENLLPHVDELTVTGFRQERRGNKDDHRDALKLAQDLRTNSIDTRVFKDVGRYGLLRELVRAYRMQTGDSVRLQNRIKALYRSRGVSEHSALPPKMQPLADLLLREYDVIQQLRAQAQKQMLQEAKRHRDVKLVQTIPGIGALRAAQLVAVIVSPHRFRTKRQLWTYSGFAVVTRSSSDWTQDRRGNWHRRDVQKTRGLNRNRNPILKDVFKGAANTVIVQAKPSSPLYRHYVKLTESGTKPNLAALTIARQIAAITLAVLKKQEAYDPNKLVTKTS